MSMFMTGGVWDPNSESDAWINWALCVWVFMEYIRKQDDLIVVIGLLIVKLRIFTSECTVCDTITTKLPFNYYLYKPMANHFKMCQLLSQAT